MLSNYNFKNKGWILIAYLEVYTNFYFIVIGLIEMSNMADVCVLLQAYGHGNSLSREIYKNKQTKKLHFFPFKEWLSERSEA